MEITHFDIKPMISHLLGIATQQLHLQSKDTISFLYLLYNPKVLEIKDEKVKQKIYTVYDTETTECDSVPFASLFGVILNYLRKIKFEDSNLNIDDCVKAFRFTRCDQNSYHEEIIKSILLS